MSDACIFLVGEGPHELGPPPYGPAVMRELPPLARLVHRLLGEPDNIWFRCATGKEIPNVHRGKMASRHGKKVYSAAWYAHRRKWTAVVVVIDREGRRNADRLSAMKEGRDELAPPFPCALGMAVEAFDAWMIADLDAIEAAGGDRGQAPGRSESLSCPKDAADVVFATAGGSGLGPRYAIVAKHVDLSLLEKACPKGFKPFAEEVRGRIGPVLARS